jgi:hypothetical protein
MTKIIQFMNKKNLNLSNSQTILLIIIKVVFKIILSILVKITSSLTREYLQVKNKTGKLMHLALQLTFKLTMKTGRVWL